MRAEATRQEVTGVERRLEGDLLCSVDASGHLSSGALGWELALGWTVAELTSRPFADFVHVADRQEAIGCLRQANEGWGSTTLETRFRAATGRWRRLRWRPCPDPDQWIAVESTRSAGQQSGSESARGGSAVRVPPRGDGGRTVLRVVLGLAIVALALAVAIIVSDPGGHARDQAGPANLGGGLPPQARGPVEGTGSPPPPWSGDETPPRVVGHPLTGKGRARRTVT